MGKFDSEYILVIGGAGFIGSNIVDRLMIEGAYVKVLDDLSNGTYSNIKRWEGDSRFNFIQGDMRNRDIVRKSLENVKIIFLEAAKVSVPFSVENPHLVLDVNILGTTTVLDEARKADIEKAVIASSSSVYGDTPILPKQETMPTNPISPYAVSKLAQENLALAFFRTYGMDTTALRYFNVYGPRQRGGYYAGVIQTFITQALANKPLTIDGDGNQTRDFTYIDDVVTANILAATSKKATGNVYNVGGGKKISIDNLADVIMSIMNSKSIKKHGNPRVGDVRDSLAGLDKIKNEIGYVPKWDIQNGIKKTIQWMTTSIQ